METMNACTPTQQPKLAELFNRLSNVKDELWADNKRLRDTLVVLRGEVPNKRGELPTNPSGVFTAIDAMGTLISDIDTCRADTYELIMELKSLVG